MFRWLDDIPFAPGMAVWLCLMIGGAWVAEELSQGRDAVQSIQEVEQPVSWIANHPDNTDLNQAGRLAR